MTDAEKYVRQFVQAAEATGIDYQTALNEFRRAFIEAKLLRTGGNQCLAAKLLGTHRNSLGRWLAKLGIEPRDFFSRP